MIILKFCWQFYFCYSIYNFCKYLIGKIYSLKLFISEIRKTGLQEWLKKITGEKESVGSEFTDEERLCMGALIAEEMRAAVLQKTGFKCSAGISHSKVNC